MSHVAGVYNGFADALSRMDTAGNYEILPDVFQDGVRALDVRSSIDLFTSQFNHNLARFVALPRRLLGGVAAEDALMFNWSQETPYVFPPVQIVRRVLQKLERDKVASAVIVVPAWPSQPWWSLLQGHVVSQWDLGVSTEALRRGSSLTTKNKLPPGRLLMARLRFCW
jgi:hypothetical protein